ncbi:hypothetical protein [Pimelobacter simplex]|uniref:hypothetical protein n=1 Tax=Nocardioides simplex TaxID=2045 RepID=UPI003AAC9357
MARAQGTGLLTPARATAPAVPAAGRRTVLAALAAGLAATACDDQTRPGPAATPGRRASPSDPPTTAPPVVRPRRSLLETTFAETGRFHPVEVVAPGFVLASATRVGAAEERHPADLPAPFVGVEAEVKAGTGGGSGSNEVTVGLASADGTTALRARLDLDAGDVSLELVAGGSGSGDRPVVLGRSRVRLPDGPFTLGLALCENRATVLVRPLRGAWRALLTARDEVAARIDFRVPATLAGLGFVWGGRAVRSARGGLFGMTGLRDPHLVQHADGTPYTEGGRVFLTWTCAGTGFFQQAHWGVFALDPENPVAMEQVAQIYVRRDSLLLGDHAGQLVRDGERWLVASSSWGDFDGSGVHVRHATSTADLLHGVHVLETEPLALPTDLDAWDPSLTRIDGTWTWAYVASPSQSPFDFHPALARADGADPFRRLRAVGADRTRHQTEGTLLVRDTDRWLVLASDGDARQYPAYDLSLRRVGRIDAPYGTNIPHPQAIVRADGTWLIITFDGTDRFAGTLGYGGHGDVVVLTERPRRP